MIRDLIESNFNTVFRVPIEPDDVSTAGQEEIVRFLDRNYGTYPDYTFDWRLITSKGKLPKRIRSWMYNNYDTKMRDDDVQEIGHIANRHQCWADRFYVSFSKAADWQAGQMGDHGSCYWLSRTFSRVALERHSDFFAVKIWEDALGQQGWGRAFGMLDTPYSNCIAMFNSYPKGFQVTNVARIMVKLISMLIGKTFVSKLGKMNYEGSWKHSIWINGGNVAYVCPPEKAASLPSVLDLAEQKGAFVLCDSCGSRSVAHTVEGQLYCPQCFGRLFARCSNCRDLVLKEDAVDFNGKVVLCRQCAENLVSECNSCHQDMILRDRYSYSDMYYGLRELFSYEFYGNEFPFLGKVCWGCVRKLGRFIGVDYNVVPFAIGKRYHLET